ncbi:MAG: rhomboid family intramembrane serine protease, partial [Spirochaetota bacterium]
MRIRYNAPVTLTFSLIAVLVLIIDGFTGAGLTRSLFSVPPTLNWDRFTDYLRLFTHTLGHADWNHLISNLAFILLLGPILEEKYGSSSLAIMVLITALITGLLNVLFLSTGLLGASGIVFMMILLSSFTRVRQGEIPLTFILVVVLYLAREIVGAFANDQISQFAHIIGGVTGSLF